VPTTLPPELGHYRILRQIGAGGMGTVYLADDTQLNCRVAIKVPHFREEDGNEPIERFYREARMAQTIHHPYICPVYDVGETSGFHYLTMPFIEGTPLNRLIGPKHEWSQRRAAELIRRVAMALEALHQRQVIHRDLKPHNIMVRGNDEPMLMDFGLARSLKAGQQRLTSTGETLGTPAYMSPEQITADPNALCPGTDVYSLGIILYEVLTGRPPFSADNLWNLFNQILSAPPPSPTTRRKDLDGDLDAVCLKALAKKPEERYASMAALAQALNAYLNRAAARAPEPVASSAPAPPPQPRPPVSWPTPPALVIPPPHLHGDVVAPCPHCSCRLKLAASLWGHKARCPQCKAILRVPDDLDIPDTLTDLKKPAGETPPSPSPVRRHPARELVNPVGMKFVWVPPGTFAMGSPPAEEGRSENELPHRVTLTRGYFLGACPVTQGQWMAVMGHNPSRFRGENRPVEGISWEDADEFCKKLSKLDGKTYRLPTEAEWEYACRAGTTTPFSFGPTLSTEQANFDGTYIYNGGKKGVYRKTTTPVGLFPPNGWGLGDLHGNVWEWCADWYGEYPDHDVTDPCGPESGEDRVLRGESWVYGPRGARSACRSRNAPTCTGPDFSCRVCFTSD